MSQFTAVEKRRAWAGLMNSAIGDALGGPRQFGPRNGKEWVTDMLPIPFFDAPAGAFSDDFSMQLAIMQAFVDAGGKYDFARTADYLYEWLTEGRFSAIEGRQFDAGSATANGLHNWKHIGLRENGSDMTLGNGAIIRALPAYLIGKRIGDIGRVTHEIAALTHNAKEVHEDIDTLTRIYERHIVGGYETAEYREQLARIAYADCPNEGRSRLTLLGALWCFYHGTGKAHYLNAAPLILAANLGNDSDSVAAVAGSLMCLDAGSVDAGLRGKLCRLDMVDRIVGDFLALL